MKRSALFFALVILPSYVFAQWHGPDAPDSLSFQGQLTKPDGTPIDTSVAMTFALYKGSSKVWEQTHGSVTVTDGVFNVILGGAGAASLDTVAFNEPIDVGVKVGNNSEMTPRTPLTAAAYALGMRGIHAVWARVGNDGGFNVIAGIPANNVAAGVAGATISGGGRKNGVGGWDRNYVTDSWGTVGGGLGNSAALGGVIGGGFFNYASGNSSVVGGGAENGAGANYVTVSGGRSNQANAESATVGGGFGNLGYGKYATLSGGKSNRADGQASTIAGGYRNRAEGSFSFAAGQAASALHNGSFVWADSLYDIETIAGSFESTGDNQFLIRASGGVGIGTNAPARMVHISGQDAVLRIDRDQGAGGASILLHQYAPGVPTTPWNSFVLVSSATSSGVGAFEIRDLGNAVGGSGTLRMRIDDAGFVGLNTGSSSHPLQVGTGGNTSTGNGAHVTTGGVWTDASSRTFKTDFEDVDSRAILDRLAALPIATWEYKDSDEGRHMGPVAEDFHDAFGLGDNERYISGTDARGVSMAAIQGLYELVREQRDLIVDLTARLEELENR